MCDNFIALFVSNFWTYLENSTQRVDLALCPWDQSQIYQFVKKYVPRRSRFHLCKISWRGLFQNFENCLPVWFFLSKLLIFFRLSCYPNTHCFQRWLTLQLSNFGRVSSISNRTPSFPVPFRSKDCFAAIYLKCIDSKGKYLKMMKLQQSVNDLRFVLVVHKASKRTFSSLCLPVRFDAPHSLKFEDNSTATHCRLFTYPHSWARKGRSVR